MNQHGVARVEHALKMLEGCVEVSSFRVVHHEIEFGFPNLRRAIWHQLTRALQMLMKALEIAHLPVGGCDRFMSGRMVWIAIERLVGPHDHVVVPTLNPARDCDL
jgi:hypothetical protein